MTTKGRVLESKMKTNKELTTIVDGSDCSISEWLLSSVWYPLFV